LREERKGESNDEQKGVEEDCRRRKGVEEDTKRLQERKKGGGELRCEGEYFLQDTKSAHVLEVTAR
jgi:hypothetical protein